MTLFYPSIIAVMPYSYSYQTMQFGEIIGGIAEALIGIVIIIGLIGEIVSGIKQIVGTFKG